MATTIKIGFLVPYSSINPNMSEEIMQAVKVAFPDKYKNNIEFYPEYIHQGNSDLMKIALNKLLQFNQVDVVSGIVSYQTIPELAEILSRKNKIGFFFDFGEYIPPLATLPNNIFFNSLVMWQQEFALGKWSQNHFGGKGAILMSVYDAGFHLHSSFWQGAISGSAQEIDTYTIPFNEGQNLTAELLPSYFEKIYDSKVEYLHAIFCGTEALDFFDLYRKSPLNGKIPLVVSPHMASQEILREINNLSLNFYSASNWDYFDPSKNHQNFKREYEFVSGKKATIFASLGYEFGRALYNSLPNWEKNDFNEVLKSISSLSLNGTGIEKSFDLNKSSVSAKVNIEKIVLPNLEMKKTIIEQLTPVANNNENLLNIHYESVSGWKNPYLCI